MRWQNRLQLHGRHSFVGCTGTSFNIKVDTGEIIVLGVYSTAVIVEDKTVQANISYTAKKNKQKVAEAVEK